MYILFSQCKSRGNTQKDWFFVLLTKKSACKHEYVCMQSVMNKRKDQTVMVLVNKVSWIGSYSSMDYVLMNKVFDE